MIRKSGLLTRIPAFPAVIRAHMMHSSFTGKRHGCAHGDLMVT